MTGPRLELLVSQERKEFAMEIEFLVHEIEHDYCKSGDTQIHFRGQAPGAYFKSSLFLKVPAALAAGMKIGQKFRLAAVDGEA